MNVNELTDQEKTALYQGRVIEAIKLHRERTGMGLKESKDAIDSFRSNDPSFKTVRDKDNEVNNLYATISRMKVDMMNLQSENDRLQIDKTKLEQRNKDVREKMKKMEGQLEAYREVIENLSPKGSK